MTLRNRPDARQLRDAGIGGFHECKRLVAGRALRDKLQDAKDWDDVRDVLDAVIIHVYGDHEYLTGIPMKRYNGPVEVGQVFLWEPYGPIHAQGEVKVIAIHDVTVGSRAMHDIVYRSVVSHRGAGPNPEVTCSEERFRLHVEPKEIPF